MSTISRRKALRLLATAATTLSLAPTFALADDVVVCGWNRSFPPYSMAENGRITGILVDCMDELLGRRMGLTVRHRAESWPYVQDLVRTGEADALCTNPTESRRRYLRFCDQPVVESLPSIFRAKDSPKAAELDRATTLDALRDFRQVDYAGNGWAHVTFPPELHITWTATLADALTMVAKGQADCFVGNTLAAMYAMRRLGLEQKLLARELAVGEPSSFHFGLRIDYPDAADIVARFSDALTHAVSQNTIGDIIMKYM